MVLTSQSQSVFNSENQTYMWLIMGLGLTW